MALRSSGRRGVGTVAPFLALLGISLALAGCGGSSGTTDVGGFNASLRSAAQQALANLQFSAIPQTLNDILTTSQVLANCTVHVLTSSPLTFRLFMDWNPGSHGKDLSTSLGVGQELVRYTWLAAVIPTTSNASPTFTVGQVPASVPIQEATHQLESHYGPAFEKPLENCELLPNGTLYGYPYGITAPPIATTPTVSSSAGTITSPP
jgi:hypothetical protein